MDPDTLRPADDRSWAHYPNTIIELFEQRDLRIDLRETIGDHVRTVLATRGLDGTFAVLTAANPRGLPATPDENHRSEARLIETLDGLGAHHVSADGVSSDGSHRERGLAVQIQRATAAALAREFGQSAFFWFDGFDFWLVGALVVAPPVRLPIKNKPAY